MKLHQFLSGTRAVLAAVPMAVVLLTGTTSAMAQTAAAVTPATPTKSRVNVVITGTVPGTPEAISFTNASVQIGSTLAQDPDPALPPVLIVDMTFLNADGVGQTTQNHYLANAQVTKIRPKAARDVIAITFPIVLNTATVVAAKTTTATASTQPASPTATTDAARVTATNAVASAPSGLATFNLTFDTNGVITGATGSIGANTFTP